TLLRMAQVFLGGAQPVTDERIAEAVNFVCRNSEDQELRDRMIRDLQANLSITVADGTMLAEDTGHVPWLGTKRASLDFDFWRRYSAYLTDQKGWSPQVVSKLDVLTDQVLERIEDPDRAGAWDRRGMVVGQVQSGKTSHYTGLVCKAVDAGYKFIVVLAGVHNSLRSQTQLRLDEGFLGVDTQIERAWKKNTNKIGAGLLTSKPLHVAYLTNSSDKGDFKKSIANQIGIPLGSQIPILLVVKKNVSVLKNLITWLQNQANVKDDQGRPFFTEFPLLLLDDEADHASVNTKETVLGPDGTPLSEQDATATNARIRELLKMFARSVYVGYTATPFANIFIHPHVNTTSRGQDLFPKHFILNLPSPSNYIGPVQVFGLGEETDRIADQRGLPITRIIDDYQDEFPSGHDKYHTPTSLPPSLRQAVRVFVLSCAARAARGQTGVHNSMLVHVTRFVNVQDAVAGLIEEELKALQNRLLFGDGNRNNAVLTELKELWESEMMPTSQDVSETLDDPRLKATPWSEIEPHLRLEASKIKIKKINGTAQDVLDYFGNPDGISVIAVGGDKLSRGLTLEGLSVSYYLRASKMYDTLMQMGRWFGYRPGYADLCRLYTTEELVSWYRHITVASEELRSDFDEMVRSGRTPEEFGLKVRTHPGGMVITGAGKLRNYTQMRVSFSGRLIESYRISCARRDQLENFLAVTRFVANLGTPLPKKKDTGHHHIWKGVAGTDIANFLGELAGYPSNFDFAPTRLADFIRSLNEDLELTDWSICLMNIDDRNDINVAGLPVGLSGRALTPLEQNLAEVGQRHLISQEHEWLDIGATDEGVARGLWRVANPDKEEPKTLSGRWARKVRSPKGGLLLLYLLNPNQVGLPVDQHEQPYLGYALSFPESENGDKRAVSYLVNNIFAQEEFEDE
ncbi:MAG: endonuclease, partial [Verrucomicrobiaceae bacterium]